MKPITRLELKRMNDEREQDFVLINVLPREKFNKQHIRTSINLPSEDSDFVQMVEKVAVYKDRKIVVYCASFECDASPKAAKKLDEAGFSQVFDYEGGAKDWLEGKEKQMV